MATLSDLARVLGGSIELGYVTPYLATSVGDLRALVIVHADRHQVAIGTVASRELDLFYQVQYGETWLLDDKPAVPRLRRGYLFTGCQGGVLVATSFAPPDIDDIIATLSDLAAWARLPWRPHDPTDADADRRRRQRKRVLRRLVTVAGTVAVVVLLRRFR